LGFWIGLCNYWAGLSPPETQAPKQSLTLADSQLGSVPLPQMMGQELAVPQVLFITQVARMQAQIPLELLPGPNLYATRPTFSLSLTQAGKTAFLEPMHPPLNGGGVLAKPVGHVIAAMPLAHQQHTMQTVIVTGFIGATDLLLERDSHGLSIADLQCFHAQTLRHHGLGKQAYYTALLMMLCNNP
jgi:hypothetical protein